MMLIAILMLTTTVIFLPAMAMIRGFVQRREERKWRRGADAEVGRDFSSPAGRQRTPISLATSDPTSLSCIRDDLGLQPSRHLASSSRRS